MAMSFSYKAPFGDPTEPHFWPVEGIDVSLGSPDGFNHWGTRLCEVARGSLLENGTRTLEPHALRLLRLWQELPI